jgi:tetratricopeptide (TPR) repeat protein
MRTFIPGVRVVAVAAWLFGSGVVGPRASGQTAAPSPVSEPEAVDTSPANATLTTPAEFGNASANPVAAGGDDWVLQLPSPVAPTRAQGTGNATSGIRREVYERIAEFAARAAGEDTPEDVQLAAIAKQDQDFTQALAKNPNTWPDAERDRRAQAVNDAYEKYLEDNPSDVNGLVLYGKFLRRMGEREAANSVFQHAHRLDPRMAVIKQQLGNYLAEEGQYVPALGFFVQAVALAPNEPLYHYQLGELLNVYYDEYLADRIYDEPTLDHAIAGEFKRAAELAPQEPGFAWRYAECFYDMRYPDWNTALAAWEDLGTRTTSPVEIEVIRLHCARVLLELGRDEEARALIVQPVHYHALEASRDELAQRLAEADAAKAAAANPVKAASGAAAGTSTPTSGSGTANATTPAPAAGASATTTPVNSPTPATSAAPGGSNTTAAPAAAPN